MNIYLQIDRLVLDGLGLAYADRELLSAAVEAELARLLGEGGLSDSFSGGAAVAALPRAAIEVAAGAEPGQLGAQIAQAVYSGIGQGSTGNQKPALKSKPG